MLLYFSIAHSCLVLGLVGPIFDHGLGSSQVLVLGLEGYGLDFMSVYFRSHVVFANDQ